MLLGGSAAFVAFGQDVTTPVDLSSSDGGYVISAPSDAGTDRSVVSAAGDLNDDGTSDALVGFPSAQAGHGAAYALLSRPGGNPYLSSLALDGLPGQRGARVNGDGASDHLGTAVSAASNPDGSPAILIGAPGATGSGRSASGSSYLVSALTQFSPTASLRAAVTAPVALSPSGCYASISPAYPYAGPADFPSCRKASDGRSETTKTASYSGYKGEGKGYKRSTRSGPKGGNIRRDMRVSGSIRLKDRTGLYDSNETLLGTLTQSKSRPSEFTLRDTAGNIAGQNHARRTATSKGAALKIELEGRPCMASGSPQDYALIVLTYKDRKAGNDFSSLAGMRVLVHEADLPDHAFSPTASNRAVISAGWLPCTKLFSDPQLPKTPVSYAFPGFTDVELYQGTGVASHCRKLTNRDKNPACGTQYQNYQFPRVSLAAGSSFPQLAVVSGSTTGVSGGGIARGILRVTPSPMVIPQAQISYTDHNVPCTLHAVAHWVYVTKGKLNGWVPYRIPDGYTRASGTAGCP